MTWAKYGAEYPDECAAAGLSDAAFRTHTEAIAWIYRMEGAAPRIALRIPKRLLPRIAASPDYETAVKELAALGWWRDHGEDWELVHHGDVVRESIRAQRRARDGNRERQRRHREKAAADQDEQPRSAAPGVTRYPTGDITRDPVQNRSEIHEGRELHLQAVGETGKRGGRRYGDRGSADLGARTTEATT